MTKDTLIASTIMNVILDDDMSIALGKLTISSDKRSTERNLSLKSQSPDQNNFISTDVPQVEGLRKN